MVHDKLNYFARHPKLKSIYEELASQPTRSSRPCDSHSHFRAGRVFTSSSPTHQLNSLLDSSTQFQPHQVTHHHQPNPNPSALATHTNLTKSKSLPCLPPSTYQSPSPHSPLLVGFPRISLRKEKRKSDIQSCPNRQAPLTEFNNYSSRHLPPPAFNLKHTASSNSIRSKLFQFRKFIFIKVALSNHHEESREITAARSNPPLNIPQIRHLLPPSNSPPTWKSSLRSQETFLRLYQLFGPTEIQRQEVIWELVQTESSYIQDLKYLITLVSQPYQSHFSLHNPNRKSPTWSPPIDGSIPPQLIRLVENVRQILILHQAIIMSLEETRKLNHGSVILKISENYLRFMDRFKPVYQDFLIGFEKTNKLIRQVPLNLKKIRNRKSTFGFPLRNQSSSDQLTQLRLSSFLLKPVQRLMKYPLFFKQLCELTPPFHPDHQSTLKMFKSIDLLIKELQELKIREGQKEESLTIRTPKLVPKKRSFGWLAHHQSVASQNHRVPESNRIFPLKPVPRSALHSHSSLLSAPSHYTRSSELRNLPSPSSKTPR